METCAGYFGEAPHLSAALGSTGGLATRVGQADTAGPRGGARAGQMVGRIGAGCRAPFGDPFVAVSVHVGRVEYY
jgi:hypothetical protein